MTLTGDDEIVAMQMTSQGKYMLFVSENGLGKLTDIDEFNIQHRGGKGVKCYKIMEKSGCVVGAKAVDEDREIMIITTEGILIRMGISDISKLGRNTTGVKLINLDASKDIRVASIAKVRDTEAEEVSEDVIKKMEQEMILDDISQETGEETVVVEESDEEEEDTSDLDELVKRALNAEDDAE